MLKSRVARADELIVTLLSRLMAKTKKATKRFDAGSGKGETTDDTFHPDHPPHFAPLPEGDEHDKELARHALARHWPPEAKG